MDDECKIVKILLVIKQMFLAVTFLSIQPGGSQDHRD